MGWLGAHSLLDGSHKIVACRGDEVSDPRKRAEDRKLLYRLTPEFGLVDRINKIEQPLDLSVSALLQQLLESMDGQLCIRELRQALNASWMLSEELQEAPIDGIGQEMIVG